MKKLLLLILALQLLANEKTFELLDDLDYASKISTKTKLNINKTPAVVSVLYADELQKLGITDVYSALESVPGIEVSMDIAGAKQINMRGNKSLVTDKLKFMVDGISINAELSGANHFYLNMPIENIERIEIIRGPASALYGSFAHIGLINVITKASTYKNGVVFARGSSEGSKNIGFTQHLSKKNIKVALSASYQQNKNSREYNSYSLLQNEDSFTSYEDFTDKELGINIELYEDITLVSKYLEQHTQNYFGYAGWPIVQDPKKLKHTSFVNELAYAPELTKEIALDMKIGYKEYSVVGDSRLHPYSIQNPKPPYPPYDLIGSGDYKEETFYADFSLNYDLSIHNLTLGTYFAQTEADGTTYSINNPSLSEQTTVDIDGGGLKDIMHRTQYALYFSDFITLNEKWMANVGLRYDHYSDANNACSPKLALLYAYSEKQSYKLMYQNSFRVPTFLELYGTEEPYKGNESLTSETIDTLEFAYRYQASYNSWINLNLFYSKMKNFIYRDAAFEFKNGLDGIAYGTELEFKVPIKEKFSLQANYSYIHSEDENEKLTPMVANHLANLMLSFAITQNWHTGTRIRYVGARSREEADSREKLKAYSSFDQTLTFSVANFLVQASVKNLFDQDVRYIAPLGNGTASGTYTDDLQQNGRTFWLSAQWRFK